MSKVVKNLLFAFTIICAFALAIFLIQLLVLNSGSGESSGENPSPSAPLTTGNGSPSPSAPTNTGSARPETASPSGSSNPSGSQNTEEPRADGTTYEFDMPGGRTKLVLFVEEESEGQQFDFIEPDPENEGELGVLSFKGNGTAALELHFSFLPDGVITYAEESLDRYVGSDGSVVIGDTPVGGSSLRGISVTGTKDRLTYEAWILSFSDIGFDDVGLDIVIYYQNPLQRDALYAIVDSMEMIQS